jgi:CO/xanthine dehydrogenase Mo-binding subunit
MVYEGGKIVNASFMDYLIPTSTDLPSFTPIILELPHKDGPYGAKGLADAGVCPTAAAIANAVYDAVGVRISDSPITAEKVLRALKDKKARFTHNK